MGGGEQSAPRERVNEPPPRTGSSGTVDSSAYPELLPPVVDLRGTVDSLVRNSPGASPLGDGGGLSSRRDPHSRVRVRGRLERGRGAIRPSVMGESASPGTATLCVPSPGGAVLPSSARLLPTRLRAVDPIAESRRDSSAAAAARARIGSAKAKTWR